MTSTRKNIKSGAKKTIKKGDLTQFGYKAHISSEKRHEALKLAIKQYGALSVWRKINAIYVLSKNRYPALSAKYNVDRNWIMKNFPLRK